MLFFDISEKIEKQMVHTPTQSIHFKGYKLLKSGLGLDN